MKKVSYYILTILGLISGSHIVCAQSPDNRVWTVTAFDNIERNEHVAYSCSFETHNDKIKWIQKGGARVTEFQIVSKTTSWSNIEDAGEVTYQISLDGNTGSIRFYRASGQLAIETNLQVGATNSLPFKFIVTSTTAL